MYTERLLGYIRNENKKVQVRKNPELTMPLKFYIRLLTLSPCYIKKQVIDEINHESGNGWVQCFDLGHLAILVAETKARCNMTSILFSILEA